MSQTTNVSQVKLNIMTQQQYSQATINPTELYMVTDAELLPSQTGNSGKFLTTNGTVASWATVDALPSQTGNSGKLLTTNGSTASWTGIKTINSNSLLGTGNVSVLENTATGTNSLTLLGSASSYKASINIGYNSYIGAHSTIAVGQSSRAMQVYSVALGLSSDARGYESMALGHNAKTDVNSSNSIQLGSGTNSTSKTFNVGFGLDSSDNEINYQLLDGTTGLIPDARISSNIARTPTYDSTNERLVFGS